MNRILATTSVSWGVAGLMMTIASVPRLTAADVPTGSPELRAALQSLFAESWEKTADGLAVAQQHHRAAQLAAPSDPRVDFALSLVQLRYLRYIDAERTLERLTLASPEYVPGLQARVYLSVLMKKHSAALAQMDDLHRKVATSPNDASRAAERREVVEFLGRVLGYYEGPAARLIAQATVADLRARILDSLGTPDREAFSAAFGAVVDRYAQLDDDKRRSQEETKASDARQKELDLQRLQEEKAGIAAEKDSLQRQDAEAQAKAQVQLDQIDGQIAPLDAAYARINAQGQRIRISIAQLDAAVSAALAQAEQEEDPGLKMALVSRANLLSNEARRAEFDYQALDAEAAQIVAQRNALQNQRAGVIAQYEATAKRLGVQAAKLGRNQTRITVEQKKALKPSTGYSPQVQDKATTAASITTYVDFPLEREKLRILNSLR